VWLKALFGAPVVNVDTEALDKCAPKSVRRLLSLPATFPSFALRWVLRLWPSNYQSDLLKLKVAWRCRHLFWFKDMVAAALARAGRRLPQALLQGPLGEYTAVLKRYGLQWTDLGAMKYRCWPNGYRDWASHSKAIVNKAWCKDVVRAGQALRRESPLRLLLPATVEDAVKQHLELPRFLRPGDLGRAGLRLAAPRLGHRPDPMECGLCHQSRGLSLATHLFECPGLPLSICEARESAVAVGRAEVGDVVAPLLDNPGRWVVSLLDREGLSDAALGELLWVYARCVDYYGKHCSQAGHEIRPIRASSYSRYVRPSGPDEGPAAAADPLPDVLDP
jgi:hypothetical protein